MSIQLPKLNIGKDAKDKTASDKEEGRYTGVTRYIIPKRCKK